MPDRPPPLAETLLGDATRQLLLTDLGAAPERTRRLLDRHVRFGSAANCTVRLRGPGIPRVACVVVQGRARTVVKSY